VAITNYTELLAAVARWLARDDLTDRIPEFIALFEAKANRTLRCTQMETRATAEVDTTSDEPEFIALPGDFQTMRRIRLSGVAGKPALECVSQLQADDIRYCLRDISGQPQYFTIFGDELELIPTPNDDFEIEMVYRANLDALSDSNAENWLLSIAPDAYLYGALLEAAPYSKDDERVPLWAAALSNALDALNSLSTERVLTPTPMGVRLEGVAP
jgi:hypothetical protein